MAQPAQNSYCFQDLKQEVLSHHALSLPGDDNPWNLLCVKPALNYRVRASTHSLGKPEFVPILPFCMPGFKISRIGTRIRKDKYDRAHVACLKKQPMDAKKNKEVFFLFHIHLAIAGCIITASDSFRKPSISSVK